MDAQAKIRELEGRLKFSEERWNALSLKYAALLEAIDKCIADESLLDLKPDLALLKINLILNKAVNFQVNA